MKNKNLASKDKEEERKLALKEVEAATLSEIALFAGWHWYKRIAP